MGGFQACGPRSNGLLMPSTAEEDFADCQSMNSRTLSNFRWGFERLSFMPSILRSQATKGKAVRTASGKDLPGGARHRCGRLRRIKRASGGGGGGSHTARNPVFQATE